jgi:hypothetical protein
MTRIGRISADFFHRGIIRANPQHPRHPRAISSDEKFMFGWTSDMLVLMGGFWYNVG